MKNKNISKPGKLTKVTDLIDIKVPNPEFNSNPAPVEAEKPKTEAEKIHDQTNIRSYGFQR